MKKELIFTFAGLAAFALIGPANAQTFYRRANLVNASDPNEGHCTVSVIVDGAASVEIRGDDATLRNLTGRAPHWQRFECTSPMPDAASELRIRAIEGNGRIALTRDSDTGNAADVRVFNPNGGPELYTFDVSWSNLRPQSVSKYSDADRVVTDDEAIQACRSAAEHQIRSDGYSYVHFGSMNSGENGPVGWVTGTATADRPNGPASFSFTCRTNSNGKVRSVDMTRH